MIVYVPTNKPIDHEKLISELEAAGVPLHSIDDRGVGFRDLSADEKATAEQIIAGHDHGGATQQIVPQRPDTPRLIAELQAAGVILQGVEFPDGPYPAAVTVYHGPGDRPKAATVLAAHNPALSVQEMANRSEQQAILHMSTSEVVRALLRRDPGLRTELGL